MLMRINPKRSIQRALSKKHNNENHWRPTVVAVVTKTNNAEVLFVLSTGRGTWGLPKGGIEERDHNSVARAAFREVGEELRLEQHDFRQHHYIGTIEDGELDKRKHQLGQRLHFVHLTMESNASEPVACRDHHVSRWQWVSSLDQFEALSMRRHRVKAWLCGMRTAGVPWAQQTENKGRRTQ